MPNAAAGPSADELTSANNDERTGVAGTPCPRAHQISAAIAFDVEHARVALRPFGRPRSPVYASLTRPRGRFDDDQDTNTRRALHRRDPGEVRRQSGRDDAA